MVTISQPAHFSYDMKHMIYTRWFALQTYCFVARMNISYITKAYFCQSREMVSPLMLGPIQYETHAILISVLGAILNHTLLKCRCLT